MRYIMPFILFVAMVILVLFVAATMPIKAEPVEKGAVAIPVQAGSSLSSRFVENIGHQAIAIMADKNLTQEQRSQKYRDILHASFDLQAIGHFVLGRAWNTATLEQQESFMQLFETLVLKTYGDRLNFYSGEGFQVGGVRQENDRDSVVSSQILHADASAPTEVDWRVRQTGNKLAIVDVVVAGVSQSVTQRQEYASILQRNDGDIDMLLDFMRKRMQELQ